MQTVSALRKYLSKRISTINSFLEKPQRLYSTEDYHQLRVEIKKTKALFALIRFSTKKFNEKKYLKPLKPLFKEAGRVRDLQLEKQTLQKYLLPGALHTYFEELDKQQQEDVVQFFALLDKKLKKKINKTLRSVKPFISYVKRRTVKKYARRQGKKITALIEAGNPQAEQIHRMRKQLKKFYYTEKILSLKEMEIPRMESFQELLGKWHDTFVMENHLQKMIDTSHLKTEEEKQAIALKKLITNKDAKLRMQIKKEMPELLQLFYHN